MKFIIHVIQEDGNGKAFFRIDAQTWVSACTKAHDKLMDIKAKTDVMINWRIKAIERETSRSIS